MKHLISISAIHSISALGSTSQDVWETYSRQAPVFSKMGADWVSKISETVAGELELLRQEKQAYKNLDRTALLAILAARNTIKGISTHYNNIGVNIGSSRGATHLFEEYYNQFIALEKVSPFASPTTTLGNVSSWVGQDCGLQGVAIDHSVTCSTAMHALLNGIAWLQAGMANGFLVGGSEAALTSFTMAQMKALKLYTTSQNTFACESLRFQKTKNTMVLGEGAAVAYIERGISKNTKAIIAGYGLGTEILEHNSSISENAICFQKSMQQALDTAQLTTVDCVVMHAPGTVKGDRAEKNAIDTVFKKQQPLLTSNKWQLGHTLGASGMFSIELAVLMLQHNAFIENPYYNNARHLPKVLNTIMVNAVGFGGNAVSIILQKS